MSTTEFVRTQRHSCTHQRSHHYREDLLTGLRLRHVSGIGGNISFPNFIPDSSDNNLGSYLREGRRRFICSLLFVFGSNLELPLPRCKISQLSSNLHKSRWNHQTNNTPPQKNLYVFAPWVSNSERFCLPKCIFSLYLLYYYCLTVSFIIIKDLCNCW